MAACLLSGTTPWASWAPSAPRALPAATCCAGLYGMSTSSCSGVDRCVTPPGTSRDCGKQGSTAHVHLCVQVAAGLGHTLAVSLDGRVLSWGWNAGSQLGLGPEFARQQVVHFPRQVGLLQCLGNCFSCGHCVAFKAEHLSCLQIYGLPESPDAIPAAGRVHSVLLTDEPTSADTQDMSRRLTQGQCLPSQRG